MNSPLPCGLASILVRPALGHLAGLLLAMLLASCASDAPYDYGLGLEVIRMDEHTRELLATRSTRPLPAAEGQRYLRESMGTLQSLHDRGAGHRIDTPESHLVEFLSRRFELLAAQKAPITRRDIARLAPDIAELRELESRQGYEWHGEPGAAAFSSDSSFDTTDDVTYARRRGERNDRHGHRDSDHRDHDRSDHGHHDSHDRGDQKDRDDRDDHGHEDNDKKR